MKITIGQLRKIIKEALLSEGYYEIQPGMGLPDILKRWIAGDKAYDPDNGYFHGYFSPEELWPYREYDWSRESASGIDVIGRDKKPYADKWSMIDDEEGNIGAQKWDSMVKKMKSSGWITRDPAVVQVGRNGKMKVGEGNHRLAIAKELGIDVPVRFIFTNEVHLSSASNVK